MTYSLTIREEAFKQALRGTEKAAPNYSFNITIYVSE